MHGETVKYTVSYESEYNCHRNIQFLSKSDNKTARFQVIKFFCIHTFVYISLKNSEHFTAMSNAAWADEGVQYYGLGNQ